MNSLDRLAFKYVALVDGLVNGLPQGARRALLRLSILLAVLLFLNVMMGPSFFFGNTGAELRNIWDFRGFSS
jgi:hypothetical protein